MNLTEFKDELKQRPGEPIPPFFLKLRTIAVYVIVIAGAIMTVSASGLYIPDWLFEISQYAVGFGAALGIGAQYTSIDR